MNKIKKKIFISLGFAALIYLGFSIYADFNGLAESFMDFNWIWAPVILSLSFCNYLFRFIKWDYYLRLLKVKITTKDSFAIFMSGLIMSVTPGKMGELLKSYLIKQIANEPISRTAPIVFAERITDFISLVFISVIGAYIYDYGRSIVLGVGIFFFLICAAISYKPLIQEIIRIISQIKFIKKHVNKLNSAYESAYVMLKPIPLLYMTFVSFFSWFFECIGFYLILYIFKLEATAYFAAFAYTFSTIAGAITMLPGGLGVTESSLTYLLVREGVKTNIAVAATFIIRAATLWFAVFVGVISVSLYQKRYGKIIDENSVF